MVLVGHTTMPPSIEAPEEMVEGVDMAALSARRRHRRAAEEDERAEYSRAASLEKDAERRTLTKPWVGGGTMGES